MSSSVTPLNTSTSHLVIKWGPIELFVEDENNARRHTRRKIQALARNIKKQRLNTPLLVRSLGDGRFALLCGHARLSALKLLGETRVPYLLLDHLTPAQARAYMIADNAFCERGRWDRDLLRGELRSIIELGIDVELTGLDSIQIDSILSFDSAPEAAAEDDELIEEPDKGPSVSQLGDHWVIGDQHLVHGDSTVLQTFHDLLGENRAAMVFSDPPFNTAPRNISRSHGAFVMGSGEYHEKAFILDFLRPVFRNIAAFCEPGAIGFVCSDWRRLTAMWDAAEGVFVEPKNLIVWGKSNAGMGGFYRQQTEYIIPFQLTPGPIINNLDLSGEGGRHRSTLWLYPGANTFRRGRKDDLADHPTVKNRTMVADAIRDVSHAGDIVLDAFSGAGTTLAAAHVSGRRGYAIELDGKYCDVSLRRLHKLTGEMPRLIDGTSFEDVAAQRASKQDV